MIYDVCTYPIMDMCKQEELLTNKDICEQFAK